ncbi:MAG: VOC family protein [Pseudomonadales bacterium]
MQSKAMDHFLILVRDLQPAAERYRRLGFHVRPSARHEDVGSANCVILFPDTYLELLWPGDGSVDAMHPYMDRFELGEGFAHMSLTSDLLEPDLEWARGKGVTPGPIMSARRKVVLPDGREEETASRFCYMWREDSRFLSIFYSDHARPETVFIPEYVDHPNSAQRVSRVVYMSCDPAGDREYFSSLFKIAPQDDGQGGFSITDPRGVVAEVLTKTAANARYGDSLGTSSCEPFAGIGVAMHYSIESSDVCAQYLSENGVRFERSGATLVVPATEACGCIAVFEE